ncbi:MAG TPA: hypothetical protein VE080_01560 [Candidatus Aquicultoraceae bacterium]|jgi:hypothetical protein|nr:hypothetical protein [Candidatus Aquicultoraceae bacterium]
MRNALDKAILLAGALVSAAFLVSTCAPARETVRNEEPDAAVHIPPAQSPQVQFWAGKHEPPPSLPYSPADETRGRWLTLFEVTFSPVPSDNGPETGEGPE